MTFWRVHSRARSTRVPIEGSLAGAHGFVVGGSPRLLELDLRLMKLQGVWSLAINNAAMVFEPQAFVSIDTTAFFNLNIFSNPRVMKFLNYSRHEEMIGDKRLSSYPNVYFFDMVDETDMMMSEFCRLEGPLPFWKNTFFTALGLMYQLGFRVVYLIGCTFDSKGGDYAFDQQLDPYERAVNEQMFEDSIEKMSELAPMLRDEGMHVFTCHEGTGLDGICEYAPFVDAISNAAVKATSVGFNKPRHISRKS